MTDGVNAALSGTLALQHGLISRRQALAAGMTWDAVAERLRRGRWRRLYPGVYATLNGEPSRTCLLWAAVLRVGQDAILSHQTAAELYRLIDKPVPLIHVTVARKRSIDRIPGIVIHHSARLDVAGHPAATPPRTRIEETVLDLTQTAASFDDAVDWIIRGCGSRRTTPQRLVAAMRERPRMRWRAQLTAGIGDAQSGVNSMLEYRHLHGVERAHGLPTGKRQARSGRHGRREYRDQLYDEFGVCVELDGQLVHFGEARWRDIRRDNASAAAGVITLRYGWVDVTQHPCAVAEEVGAVLASRGWNGRLRRCGPTCSITARTVA